MNTAKHAPGPWECKPSNAERYSQYIAPVNLKSWPYDVIAYIPEAYGDKCTFPGSHSANASLIAAAPELLEFARRVLIAANKSDSTDPLLDWIADSASTVISKATGEAA